MKLYELFEDIMNPGKDVSKDIETLLMQIKSNPKAEDKAPISSVENHIKQKTSVTISNAGVQAILGNLPMVTGLEDDMVYFGDNFKETRPEEDSDTGMTDEEEKEVVSDMAKKSG